MIDHQIMTDFFTKEFPQADFELEHLGEMSASIRKKITKSHLRPGGTVSGPVMMELADAVLYVAILN
jgi:acyl-coenzyme A thioesterase PaaI-like protein